MKLKKKKLEKEWRNNRRIGVTLLRPRQFTYVHDWILFIFLLITPFHLTVIIWGTENWNYTLIFIKYHKK